jgi:hypothetical protein
MQVDNLLFFYTPHAIEALIAHGAEHKESATSDLARQHMLSC